MRFDPSGARHFCIIGVMWWSSSGAVSLMLIGGDPPELVECS